MSLSGPINYTHPTPSDFFQNLIIAQEPISVVPINFAQQVVEPQLDRRMLAVTINACGKKTLQTKAAAHARRGPAFGADARFSLKMERNRTARRTHERALRIDRSLIVASFKFHRFLKSYSQRSPRRKSCTGERK